ncbi:uncharacterized protein MONOS_7076 [Monocercomonoides exilis]|uniref:uncharacterized protein n=1 Tax=Monocercomonoides exilis TaxID=2049356 RepID=UPI003559E64A|nr:hypothetical protein MONOS_7076 [Monocercomonoides exilis]|eukprot:MONOS_7076.1-p1 / transcript=MONOS_7076.1 / gene=MONOS_7076 / organism=Monocercomonoides_exilis_PA203 / gene_product=unspecified product / transcript_product=unspecified product / location=Mono_scaffold00234:69846-70984(-) / protein_length=322 / sequence_SO=supercontig / SO=protein_coding / is_pseudo=false
MALTLRKKGMDTVYGTDIDTVVERMNKTTRGCDTSAGNHCIFQANGTDSEKGSSSRISCSGSSGGGGSGGGGYGTTVLPASSPLLSSFAQTFPFSSAAGQINVPDHPASSGSMPDSAQVQCVKTKSIRQAIVNALANIYRQAVNLSQTHSSKSTTWGFTWRDTIYGSFFIENCSNSAFVEFVDYYCRELAYSIPAMQQQIASCGSTILIIEQLQTHTNLLQQRVSQTQTSLQNQNAINLLEQRDSLIKRTIETTQRQMDELSAELERIEEMLHFESLGQPSMEVQLLIGAVKQSMDTIQPVTPTITTTFRASVPRGCYPAG